MFLRCTQRRAGDPASRMCVTACAEGAIQLVNGKASLVSDIYCDGLGACLGHCPQEALSIERRQVPEFDEKAVHEHLARAQPQAPPAPALPCGCPGTLAQSFTPKPRSSPGPSVDGSSQLGQWPVQLTLVSAQAPYFKDADLLLVADCVPFAMGDFHSRFLKGRALAVGCPKLDDASAYIEKVKSILQANTIRSLTVVHMEVPCCSGLTRIAREAVRASGKDLAFNDVTVGLRGDVLKTQQVQPV